MARRIQKNDIVKVIAGANKGTTGKVVAVLPKKNAVQIENLGLMHRKTKPTQLQPTGGHKDIHVPVPLHKVFRNQETKRGQSFVCALQEGA